MTMTQTEKSLEQSRWLANAAIKELVEALWDASNAMCIALPHMPREQQQGVCMPYHQMIEEAHERILAALREHTDKNALPITY